MNRVELYFTRWFIICNAIYIDPSFLVWKFHADRYLLPLENRRALVFNMLFASNAEILMVYSICSIATARGILFYKSSIWKLNVEYGRFAFRDGERAEKFVLCVCFPVMQQIVFTQFLLNVSATIKFRYFNLVDQKLFCFRISKN